MMKNEESFFEGKTVLVTGGAGAIGGNLVRRLSDLDAEMIIILDNLSSSYEWNIVQAENVQFIHGDILDEEKLKGVLSRTDIVITSCPALPTRTGDNPEKDLMVNGMGILGSCSMLTCGRQRFIYAYPAAASGLDSKMPFEEHDISISSHSYQVTKMVSGSTPTTSTTLRARRQRPVLQLLRPGGPAITPSELLLWS